MTLMQYAQIFNDPRKQLSYICKYYGMRPDLVQAAGGNISIKTTDDKLYIKSSGCTLFDVESDKNISVVDLNTVRNLMDAGKDIKISEKDFLAKATIEGSQPSLETFFHSMTAKYTVHLHPIIVIEALHLYKDELEKKYTDADFVDYYKPGLKLAKKINYNKKIIFLDKHGIIVQSDYLDDIYNTIDGIIDYCASLITKHVYDIDVYKEATHIQQSLFEEEGKVYYIMPVNEFDFVTAKLNQTPDCVIYGNQNYCSYNGHNFIIGKNFLKCKQIEEVLKMYQNVTTELSNNEVKELLNWDSEKYRKDC